MVMFDDVCVIFHCFLLYDAKRGWLCLLVVVVRVLSRYSRGYQQFRIQI